MTGLKRSARRAAAKGALLQIKLLAGAAGFAGLLVSIGVLALLGAGIGFLGGSDEVAAGIVFGGCVVAGFAIFLSARKANRRLQDADAAVEQALERAELRDRRKEEALAGGLPGQVSIAEPAGAGQLSEAREAGAVALVKRGRES